MAHYTYFALADYADAAAYAAAGLEALGAFDSVEVTESGYTNVITCKIDGTAAAVFTLGNGGGISVVFGNYTNNTNNGMNYWIGYNQHGVFIDGYIGGYGIFTYAVYKSKDGVPMFTYHGTYGNAAGFVHAALDTTTPTLQANILPAASDYYSTLQAVCAAPGTSELVSVGDGASSFVMKQSNVSDRSLSVISIDGTAYLTDGYLCIAD